jgi:hypothetical protein
MASGHPVNRFREVTMRARTTALGLAAGLCCLTGAASVLAAAGASTGGVIRLFVQPGTGRATATS